MTLFNPSGKKIAEQTTDNFGDFKFDGLEEDSGTYSIELHLSGYPRKRLEVVLGKSRNIGTINL